MASQTNPNTASLSSSDPSKPLLEKSDHSLAQTQADRVYDQKFKAEEPTMMIFGGGEKTKEIIDSISSPGIECWANPHTMEIHWIQWKSSTAQKAEQDPEFLQMFFYWLPQWSKKYEGGKHQVSYQSSYLTISFMDHQIQIV